MSRARTPLPADVEVLIIGAGQAGLATAYHLTRELPDRDVLVLEAGRIGDTWTRRWESLRLFTPRRFSALPGLPFPAGPAEYPDRAEMASYLRHYACAHRLPVREGTPVDRLSGSGFTFAAETSAGVVRAPHVVLATGPFAHPHVPSFAGRLGATVTQRHSGTYRRPSDFPDRNVHVVGGGNSAAQLALELHAAGRRVHLIAPAAPWYLPTRVLGFSIYWFLLGAGMLGADTDGPICTHLRRRGDPIMGRDLAGPLAAGDITVSIARAVDARPGTLHLSDGTDLDVSAVLWCTGYRPATSWIEVAGTVDRHGAPVHRRGASPVPGLQWMGLPWQNRLDSSIIHGATADARRCVARIRRFLP